MRIAQVSEHASPLATLGGQDAGGQNVHVQELSEHLVRQGHTVVVHTRRDDPSQPRRVPARGGVIVDHVDAGPPVVIPKDELRPWMDDFAADLARQWADDRPEVVHAHFWMSGLASVAAARPLGIPVVLTLHALGSVKRRYQGAADTSPPDRVEAEARLVSEVDAVIATCCDEVAELRRMAPGGSPVTVIPCGVDLRHFAPEGPMAAARPGPGPQRLLSLGRLVERKGISTVIEAMGRLPDAELMIAGGPPPGGLDRDADVRRIRACAVDHGVVDRVHFLGRVGRAALPALIRSADAVVSVPSYEPFGMVALEAMACGVPIVVSAVGGLQESVVDGVTGLHVPPGDAASLVLALQRLRQDPRAAARMGVAARRRAESRFGWPMVARATARVYDQVASHAGSTTVGARR